MADSFIQVRPDSTGKKVDTEELTVGANVVQRQRVEIAGSDAAELAVVKNAPQIETAYGIGVRNIPDERSRASINIATAGDNTIIGGVAGQKIRIFKLVIWAQAANTVILKFGTIAINGAGWNFPAQSGFTYDGDINPLISAAGEAFIINLSANSNVSGFVIYTQG
jgi:hypothetical protein